MVSYTHNEKSKSIKSHDQEKKNKSMNEHEWILVIPKKLTKKAYSIALQNDIVPRKWHLEGQYGSRTYIFDNERMAFPLSQHPTMDPVEKNNIPPESTKITATTTTTASSSSLLELLNTPLVEISYSPKILPKHKPKIETIDATIHPERQPPSPIIDPILLCPNTYNTIHHNHHHPFTKINSNGRTHSFTFCELFAGIGGFGVALEALGGKCVFASEISKSCVETYIKNVKILDNVTNNNYHKEENNNGGVRGDIWTIPSKDIPHHDILVGGFPCQPFSKLGTQPGLHDDKKKPSKVNSKSYENQNQNQKQNQNHHNCKDDDDDMIGGRGQLYTQIVRILKECQPKAFLLENVQGLLHTDNGNALKTIVHALENEAGYDVTMEVYSSRSLTAQSRKRLFLVGFCKCKSKSKSKSIQKNDSPFVFPYIPDLKLCARDILQSDEEVINSSKELLSSYNKNKSSHISSSSLSSSSSFDPVPVPVPIQQSQSQSQSQSQIQSQIQNTKYPTIYHISNQQMDQLLHRSKSWKPAKLAWPEKICDTLDSHYGNSVGKGHSQLVPSSAPFHPRRFTPRECARLMGFGNNFILPTIPKLRNIKEDNDNINDNVNDNINDNINDNNNDNHNHNDCKQKQNLIITQQQGPYAFLKEQYRMLGNAVCPPIIAALSGSILSKCDTIVGYKDHDDWVQYGRNIACYLAIQAISPQRRNIVLERLQNEFYNDL